MKTDRIEGTYREWDLQKDELDAINEISVNQSDMIQLLLSNGLTNSQTATEMTFRGFVDPKTGRRWTPMGIKVAVTRGVDKTPKAARRSEWERLGPMLGPKPKRKSPGTYKRRSTSGIQWIMRGGR